jgi:hypothetical protein
VRCFIKRTFLILCLFYIVGTVFGGMSLGWMATHPGRRPITDADKRKVIADSGNGSELKDVSMTASDGAVLRGWQIRPAAPNGKAVILLHGVGDNRLGVSG